MIKIKINFLYYNTYIHIQFYSFFIICLKTDYTDIINDLEDAVRKNNINLVKTELNKNELISIIENYKLYQLLDKDLSKSKFFKSKFSTKKNISFLNKYEINDRDIIVPFDTNNDKYMKKLKF